MIEKGKQSELTESGFGGRMQEAGKFEGRTIALTDAASLIAERMGEIIKKVTNPAEAEKVGDALRNLMRDVLKL